MSSTQSDSEDFDQVDEAAERLDEAQQDVSRGLSWFARVYLVTLFATIVAGVVLLVYLGFVQFGFTFQATVDIGWLLEYLAIGLVALFLLWTGAMVLVALPGSFVAGTIRGIARIADAYELPNRDDGE